MSKDLESPYTGGVPDWDALYRARGDEVSQTRPVFTGDVFTGLRLSGSTGRIKARSVVVLQHPCSMRANGVGFAWQVLVAEVTNRKDLDEAGRVGGNYSLMPLPGLRPEVTNQSKHQIANFGNLYTHLGAERCGAGFSAGQRGGRRARGQADGAGFHRDLGQAGFRQAREI